MNKERKKVKIFETNNLCGNLLNEVILRARKKTIILTQTNFSWIKININKFVRSAVF